MHYVSQALKIVLLVAVVLGALGATPAPVAAQVAGPAGIMPEDTSLYLEVDAAALRDGVELLSALLGRLGVPAPPMLLRGLIDQYLTETIGERISLERDLLPWLGGRIGAGLLLPSVEAIRALPADAEVAPDMLLVLEVADDALASGFVEHLLASPRFARLGFARADAVMGAAAVPIVTYTSVLANVTLVSWPGYLAVGNTAAVIRVLDNIESGDNSLADNPVFQQLDAQFRPGTLVRTFIAPSALAVSTLDLERALARTPMITPSTLEAHTARAALDLLSRSVNGLAFGLRADGRVLALDLIMNYSPEAEAEVMRTMGIPGLDLAPVTGRLAEYIPDTAIGVISAADLAGIYAFVRATAGEGLAAFEEQLSTYFRIDMDADVLAWADGEFALYFTVTPTPEGPAPVSVDGTLLVEATAPDVAATFLEKLNASLGFLFQEQVGAPVPTPLGDDYYLVDLPESAVAYGLFDDVFVLSIGTDPEIARSGVTGRGGLATTEAWRRFIADVPMLNQPLFFLNLAALADVVRSAGDESAMGTREGQAVLVALELFEAAGLYGSNLGDGNVVATAVLFLREPLR